MSKSLSKSLAKSMSSLKTTPIFKTDQKTLLIVAVIAVIVVGLGWFFWYGPTVQCKGKKEGFDSTSSTSTTLDPEKDYKITEFINFGVKLFDKTTKYLDQPDLTAESKKTLMDEYSSISNKTKAIFTAKNIEPIMQILYNKKLTTAEKTAKIHNEMIKLYEKNGINDNLEVINSIIGTDVGTGDSSGNILHIA
jgi:hypothetical protein